MLQKLLSNTTLGHLVTHLVVVFVLAGLTATFNDPTAPQALATVGVPLALANAVVNFLRSDVPNK